MLLGVTHVVAGIALSVLRQPWLRVPFVIAVLAGTTVAYRLLHDYAEDHA